jgi:hypothetical protein
VPPSNPDRLFASSTVRWTAASRNFARRVERPQLGVVSTPDSRVGILRHMCNLYSITKGQQAIRDLAGAMRDNAGNMPPLPGVFHVYQTRLAIVKQLLIGTFSKALYKPRKDRLDG